MNKGGIGVTDSWSGVLESVEGKTFITGSGGECFLEDDFIWPGYIKHWQGKKVVARYIPQRDYRSGAPIVLIRPDIPAPAQPFFELYFNERLVMYPASFFGHIAINVNNRVFNFSHMLNENEIITPGEYFYRPPLGEFSPAGGKQRVDFSDPDKPRFDKFGRRFMRSIYVFRVQGMQTHKLEEFLVSEMERIHRAPLNTKDPAKYNGFTLFTENCTTIIRSGLRSLGFPGITGFLPGDMFFSAVRHINKNNRQETGSVELFQMPQLKVEESPYSAIPLMFYPPNWIKVKQVSP